MVSSTINFSGLMCLFLALGPATVLSAPQIPGTPVPDIWNHSESSNKDGNHDFTAGSGISAGIPGGPQTNAGAGVHSSHDDEGNHDFTAGSGINAGIPDGPQFNAGAGVHSSHRGPCGPSSGDDFAAGSGFNAGIPGGPQFNAGAGYADHHDGYPCPEPEAPAVILPPSPTANVPIYTPVPIVPTASTTTAPAPIVPTYTTPIYIPHTTPAIWSPAVPIMKPSAPLIPHPAPAPSSSPSPSPMPAFNAGSSLAPASVLAVALPVILAFFN
ncbi:uncharacterized protein N7506_011862 [Penicillium brevicompactum]|uniref:Uncharacterized protein n=1 Tax=Penicillium brevicompactum TaxID=5074 RepID=A0A9W9Q4L2_PENBR|nr:uncharacterized protein N7506_011862 [Penicillium brevicompactum]KAJ5319158.1 hypothetical protein N7506_011862 [Penicillium brevicompactum]KAJ5322732.1 hypothetical protein N7452_011021 [Penicillium brevicompactum]